MRSSNRSACIKQQITKAKSSSKQQAETTARAVSFNNRRETIVTGIGHQSESSLSENHAESFNLRSQILRETEARPLKKAPRPPQECDSTKTLDNYTTKALSGLPKPPPAPQVVRVKRATLEVLEHMDPLQGFRQRKSFKGTTFIAAMADVGLTVLPKGGSTVAIRRRDAAGSVVNIDQPHPDPEIDAVMLRSFGKRLARGLGLDEKV
ncbi:hypothetical protein F4778DRAFT_695220 [Xylariomycetidae sp. FL2044]|nr:hypothetical protein F4778DRAFT_695220 [Xylariomycetidae sp. FL2044]